MNWPRTQVRLPHELRQMWDVGVTGKCSEGHSKLTVLLLSECQHLCASINQTYYNTGDVCIAEGVPVRRAATPGGTSGRCPVVEESSGQRQSSRGQQRQGQF